MPFLIFHLQIVAHIQLFLTLAAMLAHTLRPSNNGRYFADDTFKYIF